MHHTFKLRLKKSSLRDGEGKLFSLFGRRQNYASAIPNFKKVKK